MFRFDIRWVYWYRKTQYIEVMSDNLTLSAELNYGIIVAANNEAENDESPFLRR